MHVALLSGYHCVVRAYRLSLWFGRQGLFFQDHSDSLASKSVQVITEALVLLMQNFDFILALGESLTRFNDSVLDILDSLLAAI